MSEVISENDDAVEEQVAPEGAVETAEATEAAPVETQAPDWAEAQAELEYVRQQNSELYSALQQFVEQQSAQQGGQSVQQGQVDYSALTDEFGNFNAAAFAQYQAQQNQALIGQIGQLLQPIQQQFSSQAEAATIAEGEQRLNDILASDISMNGEFAADPDADAQARSLVTTLASQIFPDNAARYGNGPRAAEISMNQAAAQVRGLLRSVGGAAVSQTQNQLATLAGAHGEPGVGGAGVEAPVIKAGPFGQAIERSADKFGVGQR